MVEDAYNAKQVKDGDLTPRHLTVLVRFWQKHHGLTPDGKFGPKTEATMPHEELSDLISRLARQEIGKGEKSGGPGNNTGPDVNRYRESTGKGIGKRGAWCAQFGSYILLRAGADVEPSSGAKGLARNVAKQGSWVAKPRLGRTPKHLETPVCGDIVVWHRGTGHGDWRGHIEIVVSYDPETDTLITIGGNHNNRKDGKGRPYAVVDFFKYSHGAWRKKLYGVSRPKAK